MICSSYTKQQLRDMIPGLSTYAIDKARMHSKTCGKGVPPPEKGKFVRQRMNREKLDHALDFFMSPTFHQISSYGTKEMSLRNGEVITVPQVVRTACHSTLVNIYQSFCQETDYTSPLSRATLFRILEACPASKRTCLKGLDNVAADGASGYETLLQTIATMETYTSDSDVITQLKECRENLVTSKLYMKTDYKAHINIKDRCADHCISHALSDPMDQKHQQNCMDHIHDLSCDRCDLFPNTIIEVKSHLENLKGVLPDYLHSDLLGDVEAASEKVLSWKSHLVRTINQDKGRSTMLKNLTQSQAVVVMDWAMKFLPMSYREKQSDWFGQKGTNWHVSVCIYKSDNDELKNRTFAHCLESTKQDWYAVSILLEHTLATMKSQLPHISEVFLRSDNAGCYHCGNLWLSIPFISTRTGIVIKRYDFSEAQSGKSYCDAKIAHMRAKIRKCVSDGKDVLCAADMKAAIDECGGVSGCQAAHLEIPPSSTDHRATGLIKGISKISNVQFEDGCLRVWKAFGIGEGRQMSMPGGTSNIEDERPVTVISDFTPPSKTEGSIKQPASEEFGCPEGCNEMFSSFSAMHDHCMRGDHLYVLQQPSTYDIVKLRWYDACFNLSENVTRLQTEESHTGDRVSQSEEPQGWALRKDKKHVRFSEKVKVYLRSVFEDGEKSGSKMNATAVARNMRVVQENGVKLFNSTEYLDANQITSFFSRLSAEKKMPSKCSEDIESAVAMIEKFEAIEEITALIPS